jgi:hypothetical protein
VNVILPLPRSREREKPRVRMLVFSYCILLGSSQMTNNQKNLQLQGE